MTYLLSLIKNTSYKAVNFLFGQTRIFIVILAWFLVMTGILFLSRPEKARKKILSQGFGFFKGWLLVVSVFLAMFLISLSSKTNFRVLHILALVAVILIVRSYFLLKKKIYLKLVEQFAKIPILALKVFAYIQIAVGILMLIFEKRIW